MESPAERPGSDVVRPHVPRRRGQALGGAAPEDQEILVDDARRPEIHHQPLAGPKPIPHVDAATVAEGGDRPSGLRVEGVQELVYADEDSLLAAVAPIRHAPGPATAPAHRPAVIWVEAPH